MSGRRVRGPKKELTRWGEKDLGWFMCNAGKSASLRGTLAPKELQNALSRDFPKAFRGAEAELTTRKSSQPERCVRGSFPPLPRPCAVSERTSHAAASLRARLAA